MSTTSSSQQAVPSPTLIEIPTNEATPISVAALVNGELISLERYEQTLKVYQGWYSDGRTPTAEDIRRYVLNMLIQQVLIDQFATQNGLTVSADAVEARITEMIAQNGGSDSLHSWLASNSYPDEAYFRQQMKDELVTQAVIAKMTADLPTGEQAVRARYLQVDDSELAQELHTQLANGADFATLVMAHSLDPYKETTQGDLGFFHRGTLMVPALEEAAFSLELNAISDVLTVTRSDGSQMYYIVQTLERMVDSPYSADVQAKKSAEKFEKWLANEKTRAKIEVKIWLD